jgi:putative nucleotidyltransferase with HDIG domain
MTVSVDYKRKIYAIRDLPTLPIIARKILSLSSDDELLAEKLGSIISTDQSLSVKVLTLANSAYYGHRAQIGTIKKAIVVIGTAMLRQFSLGVLVSKGLGQGSSEREIFWRHSILSANAASEIAKVCRISNVEIFFMAGLLHDVGKLVLDTNVPDEYKRVAEIVKIEHCSLIEAERQLFDTDHTQVGVWMAERWQLPPELVQSIGYHHELDLSALPHSKIVAVAHAASICAEVVDMVDDNNPEVPQVFIPVEIQSILRLSQEQIMEVIEDLKNRNSEIQSLFE